MLCFCVVCVVCVMCVLMFICLSACVRVYVIGLFSRYQNISVQSDSVQPDAVRTSIFSCLEMLL